MSEASGEGAGSVIVARENDILVVRGKTELARIFEVLGLRGEIPEAQSALSERFAEVEELTVPRSGTDARLLCKAIWNFAPVTDLEWVRQLWAQPPGEQWDCVWRRQHC